MRPEDRWAEELVTICKRDRMANGGEQSYLWSVRVCGIEVETRIKKADALAEAQFFRNALAEQIERIQQEAAQEATAHNIPGSPMSEEEIAAIEHSDGKEKVPDHPVTAMPAMGWDRIRLSPQTKKLLAQIRWLEQCLRDVGNDTWGDGYRAGYESGMKANDYRGNIHRTVQFEEG